MKIDILMIVPFTHLPGEPKNGRFHYLAQQINRSKAEVEIVTTDFSMGSKPTEVSLPKTWLGPATESLLFMSLDTRRISLLVDTSVIMYWEET